MERINKALSSMKNYCLSKSKSKKLIGIFVTFALIVSVLIIFVPSTKADPEFPSIEWIKNFDDIQPLSIIQTLDDGYIIAGSGWNPEAATLIKIDPAGNLQWQKNQGTIVSVIQTQDFGYVLFYHNSVVKINASGDIQSSFSLNITGARKAILTSDGSYFIIGNSHANNGEAFAWLYKVDPQGKLLWDKKFTGGFTVYDVTETYDQGCALAGKWVNQFWLAKIDSNSNLQWSQTFSYGEPQNEHLVYSIAKAEDGGYVLAGFGDWPPSEGFVPWLLKINSLGHEQWSHPFAEFPLNSFTSVIPSNYGGYVVSLRENASIVLTDSSGIKLWTISLTNSAEERQNYSASRLIRTKDGGYLVAGRALDNNAFVTKISPESQTQSSDLTILNPQSKTYLTSDILLEFTLNEPVSWIGYSLDGQAEVTITGNTTLNGLSTGIHTLVILAEDLTGSTQISDTIQFTIEAPFPTELIVIALALVVVFFVTFLICFKKKYPSSFEKSSFARLPNKQNFVEFANNRLVRTLTIIGLCILLIFFQFFFPYLFYSSVSKNQSQPFEVGISYVYEEDNLSQIQSEIEKIKNLGFSIVRINMVCDSLDPSDYSNTITDVFFNAIRQHNLRVALIISNHANVDNLDYYLGKWGRDLSYIQILNEPDIAPSWDVGALFTDDEIISKFEEFYSIVEKHQLLAQLYTNFGPGFLVRTNLPIEFSKKLDFVGFDVFMDSFLTLSPKMIDLLDKITNKQIIITEFGMSTNDEIAQSDYIIKGLNLFKNMGLRGCWIVYWNSVDNKYGIRNRASQQKVGEWIAQNT